MQLIVEVVLSTVECSARELWVSKYYARRLAYSREPESQIKQ